MLLTLAYNAFPCAVLPPTAQKPATFSAFRACLQASIHFFSGLVAQAFFFAADCALLTILPVLFFVSLSLVMPLLVFSFPPRNTTARALLPLATLLTFIAFLAFIGAFIAAFAFIAFMTFIAGAPRIAAFIGSAIAYTQQESLALKSRLTKWPGPKWLE